MIWRETDKAPARLRAATFLQPVSSLITRRSAAGIPACAPRDKRAMCADSKFPRTRPHRPRLPHLLVRLPEIHETLRGSTGVPGRPVARAYGAWTTGG